MENVPMTKVQKVGDSLGIIVPAYICRALNMQRGDPVAIAVYEAGVITARLLTKDELLQIKPPFIKHE